MLRSPHGLAGVAGFAVLAQHHLGLVLQGLHVLRVLQASRFWTGAAVVSSSRSPPCPHSYPGPQEGCAQPYASLLPPREDICAHLGLYGVTERKGGAGGGHQNSHSSSPTTSLEGLGQESATWFEEDQGLHAGKLRGIHGQRPETRDGVLQESHLHAGQCQPALGAASSRHLRRGQQGTAVQRQRPLYGSEEEEFTPRLFQQNHLCPERE